MQEREFYLDRVLGIVGRCIELEVFYLVHQELREFTIIGQFNTGRAPGLMRSNGPIHSVPRVFRTDHNDSVWELDMG